MWYLNSCFVNRRVQPCLRYREYIKRVCGICVPLGFCATQWVEDLRVVERALQLIPDVTKYVNAVLKKPPSQVPKTATFVAVRDGCFDELLVCKLKFFAFVAHQLLPYLTKFQSSEPMVPFLSGELESLIRNLMTRCIKPEVVRACNTLTKLANFDPENKENHQCQEGWHRLWDKKSACRGCKKQESHRTSSPRFPEWMPPVFGCSFEEIGRKMPTEIPDD